MLSGPQDSRGSGAAAGGECGSATANPTQQGTVFGAKGATAEFRIKVSSKIMQRTDKVSVVYLACEKMALRVNEIDKTAAERVATSALAQIQAVPAQSLVDFEVEDDDVDIENEMLDTSVAHGVEVLEEEDAVSALLSLAGWVHVVEEDMK